MSIVLPRERLDRARMLKLLERWAAPLGSLMSKQRPGQAETTLSCHRKGSILFCSACTKVVGFGYALRGEDTLLDPLAGWVLERRRQIAEGIICGGRPRACSHCGQGETGCFIEAHHEHPLACSDACEAYLLTDKRFDHCEPPFGYQRGGPFP